MLYFLKSVNSDTAFYLVNNNEFNVGRKDCDFLIEKDASVSRKHAELRIKETKRDEIVTLKDLGSKYKTLHNGKEVTPNIEIQIKCDDKIQFGGLSSIFILKQEKFVTTATKLSSKQKNALNKQLVLLKGKYVDNWNSECTHLTLETINLTVKVLQALLDNKPIVLPSFWAKYAENITKSLLPPDINEYNNPPVGEALLNKVEIRKDICRKELFRNKTFLFFTEKEKKQVDQLIVRAGGTAISWENNPIDLKNITESTQEFLLMQTTQLIDDKTYDEIVKHFSKQSMRTIPFQEIAMAIIHGSCSKDCNPLFNRASEVFHTKNAGLPTQNVPLVENTQTQTEKSNSLNECKPKIIHQTVPESLDNEVPPIKKRKPKNIREEIESIQLDDDNPFKRIKLQDSSEVEEENIENRSPCKETKVIINDNSQASTSKRTVDVNVDDENPFSSKSMKLNSDWCSSSRVTEQKNSSNETHQGNNKIEQNSVSQSHKRKADSPKEFDSNIQNMFKQRRTEKTINETYDSTHIQSSGTGISADNPFAQNTSNIFSSTQINERTVNQTVNYTKSTSSNLNGNWISKNSPVNVDYEMEEKIYDDMNEARKKLIDSFKNKLIVEIMSQLAIRSRCSRDETDYAPSNGKNFKRFKKVKPLHPQTLVISKDSFVVQGVGEVTGINDTRRILNDSDDETTNKKKNKKKLRSFDI